MPEEYEERTEQATPRRRQKAKEQGQVARSRELISMTVNGGAVLAIIFGSGHFILSISQLIKGLLSLKYGTDPFYTFKIASNETILTMLPFFGLLFLIAILTGMFQGGLVIKPINIDLNRISPLAGFKRIFSISGLSEFFKSLFKFIVGGVLFYYLIKASLPVLSSLSNMNIIDIAGISGDILLKTMKYCFLSFFSLAVIDFFIERWRFERSIRMSKEEIKEEMKETEGDPLIKARIKSIQMDMARKRMLQKLPQATVVITNPTHIAVAIQYDAKQMPAPKVIAKGAEFMAEKIKEIAKRHDIPIVEDKPLARVLYKLNLDSYIPPDLYKAVAKILAYIYKLRGIA